MKRTTLTAHESSDSHSVAVEHKRNRTARPGTSIAEQSIQKMNRAVVDKLDKLFRNAHAIAKNNRPFSDYVWMATVKLDERKGQFLGETYRNEKACKEFIHSIANKMMEKDKVTAEMKDVKFITVVSDGSTWNVTGHRSRRPNYQTTKRLAALAVPLVMLVYQTQNRRVARDSES